MYLSIVIPVYNGERYIRKCFDSIINQNLASYEIIVVDDGSSDNSIDILREYENKYNFIKVYSQTNKGAAAARNVGLQAAKGDFVAFMDCDDWLDEGCLNSIIAAMVSDVDMLIFGWRKVGIKKNIEFVQPNRIYGSGKEYLKDVLKGNIQGPNSQCWHLYRRNMLEKSGIMFDERFRRAMDTLFNSDVMSVVSKVQAVETIGYNWRTQNLSSLTYFFSEDLPDAMALYEKKLRMMIEKFGLANDKDLLGDYYNIETSVFWTVYRALCNADKERNEKKRLLRKCLCIDISDAGIRSSQKGIKKGLLLKAKKHSNLVLLKMWEMTYWNYWKGTILSIIMTYIIPSGSARRKMLYKFLGKKECKEIPM